MAGLVCYDVSSGTDESESEADMDIKPEIVLVEYTGTQIAQQVLDEMLLAVVTGTRDFSDMYIKEEPMDPDELMEIKEEFDTDYRESIKVELDSDDSDDSDSSVNFEELTVNRIPEETSSAAPKTKNELRLQDLPPVEDLDVAVPQNEVVKIGTITGSVDELVVVESSPGHPAVDIDSVLFLDSGERALGRVFDVIGPVSRPLYCVRFNSSQHIQERQVAVGMDVFYAPKSEHTAYVFLDQLMKLKISDASWRDDEEPPPQFLDYSDDEEERFAKQSRANAKKAENANNAAASGGSEVERKKAKYDEATVNGGGAATAAAAATGRRGRGRMNATAGGGSRPSQNYNSPLHNDPRHNNGLYDRTTNPFYRQTRNYDPRDMGPIRWNNYSTPPPPPPVQSYRPPPHLPEGGAPGYFTSHGSAARGSYTSHSGVPRGSYTAQGGVARGYYTRPTFGQQTMNNHNYPYHQQNNGHPHDPGFYGDNRNFNHQPRGLPTNQSQQPPPPGDTM